MIVKPSAYAPNIAGVMKEIIETAFPHQEVILFLGGEVLMKKSLLISLIIFSLLAVLMLARRS